jgi:hypothetical protein
MRNLNIIDQVACDIIAENKAFFGWEGHPEQLKMIDSLLKSCVYEALVLGQKKIEKKGINNE